MTKPKVLFLSVILIVGIFQIGMSLYAFYKRGTSGRLKYETDSYTLVPLMEKGQSMGLDFGQKISGSCYPNCDPTCKELCDKLKNEDSKVASLNCVKEDHYSVGDCYYSVLIPGGWDEGRSKTPYQIICSSECRVRNHE